MNVRAKVTPDETRARIIDAADALFRRMGYAKTAVADIAAELRMSPANVYRFFPSKHALIEAICDRCLRDVQDKVWAAARAKAPAPERLERVVLEILKYHKETLIHERRVYDMVQVAMEHSWETIRAHKENIRNGIELILRDGIEDGTFEAVDPRETAQLVMGALVRFMHPMLVAEFIEEDQEAQARASVRFVLRAITPRR